MTNINFILSTAQFVISLLDVKQQLLTGTKHSNTFLPSDRGSNTNSREQLSRSSSSQLSRSAKEIHDSRGYYTNPLLTTNSPDPGVLRLVDGSGWAMVTTSNNVSRRSNPYAFPMYYSRDLVTWEPRGHVFTGNRNWPSWAEARMWAPELHWVKGSYVVYFTAADDRDKLNIGAAVAKSSDPFGDYRDIGKPLIVDENSVAGALDPHYFLDPVSDKHFLIWKEDDPLVPSLIKIRELRSDGLAFRRGSSSQTILRSTLSGERFVTEAPWMMYKDGYYYLFYSSAWFFEAKYHMRVAKAKQVTGPYVKRRLPVLETDWGQYSRGLNTTWVGPGHGSVVSVGEDWWLIYHAWLWGKVDQEPGRQLLMDKMSWQSKWPVVGSPSSYKRLKPNLP